MDCPEGTYNNGTGLSSAAECIKCDAGKYCPSTGLIEPHDDCSAGYFCVLESIEPTPDGQVYGYKCPIGHYCEKGTKSPTPCPQGTYNGQTGIAFLFMGTNYTWYSFIHFCQDCCSKQELYRDYFLALALALAMISLCFWLRFSNAKDSRLMKLHTHFCHDALCLLQLTVTDLDLLFMLG